MTGSEHQRDGGAAHCDQGSDHRCHRQGRPEVRSRADSPELEEPPDDRQKRESSEGVQQGMRHLPAPEAPAHGEEEHYESRGEGNPESER